MNWQTTNKFIQYEISAYIARNLRKPISGFSDRPTELQCYKVFSNFRVVNNTPKGLMLTTWGKTQLQKHFKHYTFNNDNLINGKVLIKLDEAMEWPYYVNHNTIVLFNESDAAWFRLNGSDLLSYLNLI